MELFLNRPRILIATCLLGLLAGGLAVKYFCFPSVDERYFSSDYQQLQHAPPGFFILRPTHFHHATKPGCAMTWTMYGPSDIVPRFSGQDANIGQIFAIAYDCPPARLILPVDLPARRYDLLVTVREKPAEKLQAKLTSTLGCVASWQQQEMQVWQLKAIPGKLSPSPAVASQEGLLNGRLRLTHVPVSRLLEFLESALGKPVEDRTGLTGYYDFSLPASWRNQQAKEPEIEDGLAQCGLTMEPVAASTPVLVVSHVQ